MRNTITVMNAKGGVGKSTLILALAETLADYHGKKILVVDSDAQASISHMLLPQERLEAAQSERRTLVDYLIATVLNSRRPSGRSTWSPACPTWTMHARSTCCPATRTSPCSSGRSPRASTSASCAGRWALLAEARKSTTSS